MRKILYIFVNNDSKNYSIVGDPGDDVKLEDTDAVKIEDLVLMAYKGYSFYLAVRRGDNEEKTLALYDKIKKATISKTINMYIVYTDDITNNHSENVKKTIDYHTLYISYHRRIGDQPGNYEEVLTTLKCKVDKNGHRTVISTFMNYEEILKNDSTLSDRFLYNKLTGLLECREKWYEGEEDNSDVLGEFGLIKLLSYFSKNYGLDNQNFIEKAVRSINKKYNPVADELDKLVWDGKDRLHECMCRLLGCEDNWYTWVVCSMMMFGFVNRAYMPGCNFQLVPVLYGAQGLGKGAFCSYFTLGNPNWYATIKPEHMIGREKETGEKLAGRVIVEIEEMTMSDAGDKIADIKGFLSRTTDTYRDAYARGNATDHNRGCIFIATSNNNFPLPADITGARRYMSIPCNAEKIDQSLSAKSHYSDAAKYFSQVIAQAVEMYKAGKTVTAIPENAMDFCKLFMNENEAREYIENNNIPERLRDTIEEMQMAEQPRDGLAEAVAGYLEECITVNCVCVESVKEILAYYGYNKTSDSARRRKAMLIMDEMEGWEKCDKPRHCGSYIAMDTEGKPIEDIGKNGKMKSWGTQRCWVRTGSIGVNGTYTVKNDNPKDGEEESKIITFPVNKEKAEEEAQMILSLLKEGTFDFSSDNGVEVPFN